MSVYHNMSRDQMERIFFPVAHDLVKGVVDEHAAGRRVREQDRDFIASFFAHALSGTIRDWIGQGMNVDPRLLMQGIATVADGSIETALGRLEIPGGYVAGSEGNVPEGGGAL